jgi:putative transposase
MKYVIIKKLRLQYPVKNLCDQMELSENSYYSWCSRPLSRRQQDDTHLKVVIKAAHKRTRETFGPERLQQDIVKNEGVQVGIHRIKRLRKELGLRYRQKRKFKATTNSNHSLPVAPNLAAHKDLFTGEIVGYALDKRMTKALVMKSLFRAVAKKHPSPGLIHHSV